MIRSYLVQTVIDLRKNAGVSLPLYFREVDKKFPKHLLCSLVLSVTFISQIDEQYLVAWEPVPNLFDFQNRHELAVCANF